MRKRKTRSKPGALSRDEIASLGGLARSKKLSARRRREIARHAALTRWAAYRRKGAP